MDWRRLVVGLAGLNVLLMAALLVQGRRASAAGDAETIRARALELVDERGRVRGQITVEPDGEAVFRLRDAAGQIRVKLGAGGDGSGLLLLDGSTEPGIHMLARTGGTSVTLTSRGGQPRVITP
jgi:hypothetical protein